VLCFALCRQRQTHPGVLDMFLVACVAQVAVGCLLHPLTLPLTIGVVCHVGTRLKGGAAGPSGHDPLNGLPSWMLTSGTTGLVQCWDFDTPVASYTVCGLDPGETRHVYQSVECLPYTTASTTGGSHSLAGGIRAAERTAAGTLDAHFATHNTEDGLSMTHLQSHLNLDAPMAILCQQPKLVTETARGLGSSLAGLPSPAQQVPCSKALASISRVFLVDVEMVSQMKGPVPASTRHENGINSMSWIDASYGRLLVTGGRDGVVKLWR
jgi:WD40 repeat protein